MSPRRGKIAVFTLAASIFLVTARVTVNPGLGPIPIAKWSRVHGVHSGHHLRQFGV